MLHISSYNRLIEQKLTASKLREKQNVFFTDRTPVLMTSVRFELTPFRTRALIWRLRPLGQLIIQVHHLTSDPRCQLVLFCCSCRRLHKQEMLEVRQQLKSASVSSKGGEKESDRLKKELDKAR